MGGYRGDWKIDSIFSAPSLYFFRTLLFCFSSIDTTEAPRGISPLVIASPLTDWSEDSLGEPTETADSFDFSDGETGSADDSDVDGVMGPALDDVDADRAC